MADNTIPLPEGDYLFIAQSQLPNAGNGLYTAIDIYKDEVVALFKGKLLTTQQAKRQAETVGSGYFVSLVNGSIMDSANTACFAKYANDALGYPNPAFKNNTKIALNDYGKVCLIATRNIKTGAEVFCSYGKKYWAKHG